jgi:hypothetical protein
MDTQFVRLGRLVARFSQNGGFGVGLFAVNRFRGATTTARREGARDLDCLPGPSLTRRVSGGRLPTRRVSEGSAEVAYFEIRDSLTARRGHRAERQTDSHSHAKPSTWHPTGTSRA